MNRLSKGIAIGLCTAIISGFSVFLNKFAVQFWTDSSVFTTAKNLLLAVAMTSAILIFRRPVPADLKKDDWLKLVAIGVIGGSIPFLLFFKGLTLASAANAAIIHKTMFIWVALFAYPFLKEKLSVLQLAALFILGASVFLANIPGKISFGRGELLILVATWFWAIEAILVKKLAPNVSFATAAWARMFFGSIAMTVFLCFTGRSGYLLPVNGGQFFWLAVTAMALAGYVLTFYSALKFAPASIVTSLLVISAPITIFLDSYLTSNAFPSKLLPSMVAAGLGLIILVWPDLSRKLKFKTAEN